MDMDDHFSIATTYEEQIKPTLAIYGAALPERKLSKDTQVPEVETCDGADCVTERSRQT
jgi:hypothetical protein